MNIIRPDIYDNTTLKHTVETLSDKNIAITDDALINLVTKYFYAYFYPGAVDRKVPLKEIEELFQTSSIYFALSFAAKETKQSIDYDRLSHEGKIMFDNEYAVSMLGSFGATVAVVKDIVSRKLEATLTNNHYNGLDLWSGTGILLLAQYILARRNSYDTIKAIGIEINNRTSARSCNLVEKLWPGQIKIINEDTTRQQAYQLVRPMMTNDPIVFFSNENIPTTGDSMWTINDPFYENTQALYAVLSDRFIPQTQSFPQKMRIQIRTNGGNKTHEATHSNKWELDLLHEMQSDTISYDRWQKADGWNIFQQVYPMSIQVGDILLPMDQVGDDIIQTGKINKSPMRNPRWAKQKLIS